MGSKYTTQSSSGYNASPPSDDGATTEANKVKWSTIKTKLTDTLKTFAESINSALVTALDHSARSVTISDTAVASDNERVIEVKTSSVNITLSDAATMAAGYMVTVANQSAGSVTLSLATATNTIDMVTNATATIGPLEARRYIVNAATTGYITASAKPIPATQANQESATSTDVFVTPGRQQYHPSAAKAWGHATYSGGVPTLAASYNISGIVDNGVGDIDFTIGTDMSSGNFCCGGSADHSGQGRFVQSYNNGSAVLVRLLISTDAGIATDDITRVSMWAFGDQA